jgi:prolyl oligopeptidase
MFHHTLLQRRLAWLGAVFIMSLPLHTSVAHPNTPPARVAPEPPDPHVGLEDVMGEAALNWVRQRNAQSEAVLQADPRFEPLKRELREVLDASDRIPAVTRHGAWLYNFWQDAQNPRGIWRRTTLVRLWPAWLPSLSSLRSARASSGEPSVPAAGSAP